MKWAEVKYGQIPYLIPEEGECCDCGTQATRACNVSVSLECGHPTCSIHGQCKYHNPKDYKV